MVFSEVKAYPESVDHVQTFQRDSIARDLLDGNLLLMLRTFCWRTGKTPCGQQWVSRRRRVSLPCAREESQRYARARGRRIFESAVGLAV
uniref:Uncharacterized protein n=1 Tax=Trichogramma kaykai TaxID=54128 RepID=A0ABD2WFF0_9HYME